MQDLGLTETLCPNAWRACLLVAILAVLLKLLFWMHARVFHGGASTEQNWQTNNPDITGSFEVINRILNDQDLLTQVPSSTAYAYGLHDSLGHSMDCLRVLSAPLGQTVRCHPSLSVC